MISPMTNLKDGGAMTGLIALSMIVALVAPVAAQDMPMAHASVPLCPKDAEPIPAALAAWAVKTPLVAAIDASALGTAMVSPGVAYDLSLADTPIMQYSLRPAHLGAATSHGGVVGFTITQAGTYRIAVGAGAWLDVVRDKIALPSVGHGHGPNCSGIRKMVDFALRPGSYTLQIVGNNTAATSLLIVRIE